MITDRLLEDYHDEALSPDDMQRVAEALRRDPALRRRLASIRSMDDLVRTALLSEQRARPQRRRPLVVPFAAAAGVVIAVVGLWLLTAPSPAPRVAIDETPGYEPVRLVFSLPLPNDTETVVDLPITPPVAVMDDTTSVPRLESLSKLAVHSALSEMPVDEQIEVCRVWLEDPRIQGFVFDHLKTLRERDELTHDLARLGTELGLWPDMEGWIRSYLPAEAPRPSSTAGPEDPTTA